MKIADSIKAQFVPFKQADLMRMLGFDEICFGYYRKPEQLAMFNMKKAWFGDNQLVTDCGYVKAPTWQQAFEWVRIQEKGIEADSAFKKEQLKHLSTILDTMNV